MHGYENNPEANKDAFDADGMPPHTSSLSLSVSCIHRIHRTGWFDTGDMGYLDEDGYLYLTGMSSFDSLVGMFTHTQLGRSKEVINRGGEIISPFDIEDVVITHPSVLSTVAFSVPHEKLQETIGVVVVTRPGMSPFHFMLDSFFLFLDRLFIDFYTRISTNEFEDSSPVHIRQAPARQVAAADRLHGRRGQNSYKQSTANWFGCQNGK